MVVGLLKMFLFVLKDVESERNNKAIQHYKTRVSRENKFVELFPPSGFVLICSCPTNVGWGFRSQDNLHYASKSLTIYVLSKY